MATFVKNEIMGMTLEITDRYSNVEAQGIGVSGVIWYVSELHSYPEIFEWFLIKEANNINIAQHMTHWPIKWSQLKK